MLTIVVLKVREQRLARRRGRPALEVRHALFRTDLRQLRSTHVRQQLTVVDLALAVVLARLGLNATFGVQWLARRRTGFGGFKERY